MFNQAFGGQASWLVPGALILLAGGLIVTWRRSRTDRTRAALVLWGGWLLVTGIAISLGKGIIHEYYTVALVPAIGALVGIGGAVMWRRRDTWFARATLAVAVLATTVWAFTLLGRTPDWAPALRPMILVLGLAVSGALLVPTRGSRRARRARRRARRGPRRADGVRGVDGPERAHRRVAHGRTGERRARLRARRGGHPAAVRRVRAASHRARPAAPCTGLRAPGIRRPERGRHHRWCRRVPGRRTRRAPGRHGSRRHRRSRRRGGLGGLLGGTTVSTQLTHLLEQGSDGYRWTAAAVGANNAASYQLASGRAIMAIGGFNGSDPAPTLAQFQSYVRHHRIHYFLGGVGAVDGLGGPGGSSGTSSAISTWVSSHFTATTVGGVTVYDLSSPTT